MRRRPGLPAPPRPAEVAALSLILTLVALAAGRDLGTPSAEFDEGVYLASADALDRGAELGTDVFASQPPLFFVGLRWAAAVTGGDPALIRAGVLLLALGGVVAGALVVRRLAGPAAGCLAALLVGLSPAVVDRAAVVSADVPSLALGLMALAAAGAAARRPGWAAVAGGLVVAAVLVKLLAAPFVIAVLAGAWRGRARRSEWILGCCGGLLVAAAVLAPLAGRWGALWHGSVGIRGAARGVALGDSGLDVRFVLGFVGLAIALAAGVALARPRSWREWLDERAALVALLAGGVALLAVQRPLFLHHWALLSVPMAVLAASAAPSWTPGPRQATAVAAAGVAVLLLLPGAVRGRNPQSPRERARVALIAAAVRGASAPADAVVSDLPLVPLAAGREAIPDTIDASLVRVGSGALDEAAVLRAARSAEVVVVGRAFATMPGLGSRLAVRFPRAVRVGDATVWLHGSPSAPIR